MEINIKTEHEVFEILSHWIEEDHDGFVVPLPEYRNAVAVLSEVYR